jgi:hypothetical protein
MTIQNRLEKLENQLNTKQQSMPDGLSPMEKYLYMIHNVSSSPKKYSSTDTMTPEQAYLVMTGCVL